MVAVDTLRYFHPAIAGTYYRKNMKSWKSIVGSWSKYKTYSAGQAVYILKNGKYYTWVAKQTNSAKQPMIPPTDPLDTNSGSDAYWAYHTYYVGGAPVDDGQGQVEYWDLGHTKLYSFLMRPHMVYYEPELMAVGESARNFGLDIYDVGTQMRYFVYDQRFMTRSTPSVIGARWAKRYMEPGEILNNPDSKTLYFNTDCSIKGTWVPIPDYRQLVAPGVVSRNFGGNVGTINCIYIKNGYWMPGSQEDYEIHCYGYDRGLLEWNYYRNGKPAFKPLPNIWTHSTPLDTPDISVLCYGGPIPGPYLSAVGGGYAYPTQCPVMVNRAHVFSWETFTLKSLGSGYYNIISTNGQYLCAENGGGGIVNANRPKGDFWERFKITKLSNGYYTIQTFNGYYLCAEGGGEQAINA